MILDLPLNVLSMVIGDNPSIGASLRITCKAMRTSVDSCITTLAIGGRFWGGFLHVDQFVMHVAGIMASTPHFVRLLIRPGVEQIELDSLSYMDDGISVPALILKVP